MSYSYIMFLLVGAYINAPTFYWIALGVCFLGEIIRIFAEEMKKIREENK